MEHSSLILLVMINIPMYIGVGRLVFKNWLEFREGLITIYRNRNQFNLFGWDHMGASWGEMKTFLYIVFCICALAGQIHYFAG